MKKTILYLLTLFVISCNQENKEVKKNIEEIAIKKTKEIEPIKEISLEKKVAEIILKDNVLEVYQPFEINQLIGDSIQANLENTTGAMLSAYSLDKGKYNLFYRTKDKDSWNEWKQLHLNHHVNNPERKVYDAVNIKNDVTLLQFKSNFATKSDVVFRLYKFPNN